MTFFANLIRKGDKCSYYVQIIFNFFKLGEKKNLEIKHTWYLNTRPCLYYYLSGLITRECGC